MTFTYDLYWSFRSPYSYFVMKRLVELERASWHADGFVDALETTTTIYRLVHHGRSRAVDAWQSVLGERVPA